MKFLIIFAIFCSASAIKFQCGFLSSENFSYLSETYTCFVSHYNDAGNEFLTAVYGRHDSGKTNLDVKGISWNLITKDLDFFPKGIEKIFPNLEAICVLFGEITKLSDELKGLKNLKWIGVSYSSLEFLDGNLFSNNKHMKAIYFDSNRIQQVGEGLLDGLDELERVDFSGNICIHENAQTKSGIEELKKNLSEKCKIVENSIEN